MATVIHVDGLSTEPVEHISIESGASLLELVERFGGRVRVEHKPDSVYPFEVEEQAVAVEVNRLLDECKRWDELPAPLHAPGDPCTICEAIRVAEDLLP